MKIVIVGAGEVGYYLAKRLISEGNDVVIIEMDTERYRRASESLDAIVIQGSGSSVKILAAAEVGSADVLIAVSALDEVNILACMIAKEMGARKCVARVRNNEFSQKDSVITAESLGIDLSVYPEQIAADAIVSLVRRSAASKVVDFEGGKLQIMALQVRDGSPIIDRTVEDIDESNPDNSFLCLCIHRDNKTIIPRGKNVYRSGDIIYFIAQKEDIPIVSKIVGYSEKGQQHVMILGAGKVGRMVAAILSSDMDVKLIEENREVAESVTEELRDTLILHGDGTDIDFLISERVEEMDCFVAVSGSEKTNLLSGLLAQYLGVKRVIIHLTTNDYIPIMNKIGMDAVVSKNIATVNAIMKYIRRGNVIAVSLFEDIEAEAIEMIPKEGSLITKKPIQNLHIPTDIIIGAVIRYSEIIIPQGDTQIQANDKVVVFLKPNLIPQIENFFN